jgi:hypothetical protein
VNWPKEAVNVAISVRNENTKTYALPYTPDAPWYHRMAEAMRFSRAMDEFIESTPRPVLIGQGIDPFFCDWGRIEPWLQRWKANGKSITLIQEIGHPI